jgi:serine/threonine-protein kinase
MAPPIRAEDLPRAFGPYLLVEQLGVGATGEVYLAKPLDEDRSIHAPVVIKRLLPERAEDPEFVRRFRHEARVAVQVDSPHVAGVFDVGSVDGDLYIAMEYVSGWPMTKMLQEVVGGRVVLRVAEVVEMIGGALEGLRAIHDLRDRDTHEPLDVVHRDVSPRNLMIGTDGAVRIIDLGIGLSRVQSWQTRTGRVLGAVGYMSPEQITGKRVDRTADLYALGVVMYELLAGRRFIEPGPAPEMMRAGLRPRWEKLAALRSDVSPELDGVLELALGRTPDTRFQSAADFLDALHVIVPKESAAGSTRALLLARFGAELDAERRRLREVLGRAESTTVARSDTELVVFASGARFRAYDSEASFDTHSSEDRTVLAGQPATHDGRADSGLVTEPPQSPLGDTVRLDIDPQPPPAATVLIPAIEEERSLDQRRVITRVTAMPAPKRRWVAALLLLLLGILLGIASRALLGV